jgi:hypothetical protein
MEIIKGLLIGSLVVIFSFYIAPVIVKLFEHFKNK